MRYFKLLIFICTFLTLYGCATASVNRIGNGSDLNNIKTIAMSPGGGVLAEAISIELSRKYVVLDSNTTADLFVQLGLTEASVMLPQNITKLKTKGIDAYCTVRAASQLDGVPQTATIRLNNTETGMLISGVTWNNAWGGRSGSLADRIMRKSMNSAAEEIVSELIE